jgi:hypothetical protein
MLNSAGKVVVHATAKAQCAKMFAFENELANYDGTSGTNHSVDTAYASGDLVYYGVPTGGAEVYGLVAAGADAIVVGDLLESAGDGTLRKLTAASQLTTGNYTYTPAGAAIAKALEAVDNSGGSDPARIIFEVL